MERSSGLHEVSENKLMPEGAGDAINIPHSTTAPPSSAVDTVDRAPPRIKTSPTLDFFREWGDAFPNQLLGAATLDRLRHGAYRVVLDGKSYRSPKPLDNQLEKHPKSGK